MIHLIQHADVQVAEIPGKEQGGNLAFAVFQNFIPARPPFKDKVNPVRPITVPDDIATGANLSDFPAHSLECLTIIERERHDA